MNREWHKEHKMERGATEKERVKWHLEHARVCGCRPFPAGLTAHLNEAQKRQIAKGQTKTAGRTPAAVN